MAIFFIFKDDLCTVKYDNGDSYFGQVKGQKKHGLGRQIFSNGIVVDGLFYEDSWIESGYERVTKP